MPPCDKSDEFLGCGGCKYHFLEEIPSHLTIDAAYTVLSLYTKYLLEHGEPRVSRTGTYVTCAGEMTVRQCKPSCHTSCGFPMQTVRNWLGCEGKSSNPLLQVPRERRRFAHMLGKQVVAYDLARAVAVPGCFGTLAETLDMDLLGRQAGTSIIGHVRMIELHSNQEEVKR